MSDFPKHWVEALFKRFSVMYGSKWTAMWADVPMADVLDAWQEDLNGVNAEQVKRALDYLKANNPFPPTLPEFLSVCRQFKALPQNVTYLPAPPSRMPPEVAEQLREFVAGKRKGDCRDWARKILASPKDYPWISRQFAEEALGVVGDAR
jgi:hypothetical protein